MNAQLGTSASTFGSGRFGLGAGDLPSATGQLNGGVFVRLNWLTPARITQVATETVAEPNPNGRVAQVGIDVPIAVQAPPLRMTQVGMDIVGGVQPPGLRITQVATDVVQEPTPGLRASQLAYEAVIFAPPTRWANASAQLSKASTVTGTALVRAKEAGEKERQANAYVRLAWPNQGGGAPLPDPTQAPVVTVTN
jgi:hypothetical protein